LYKLESLFHGCMPPVHLHVDVNSSMQPVFSRKLYFQGQCYHTGCMFIFSRSRSSRLQCITYWIQQQPRRSSVRAPPRQACITCSFPQRQLAYPLAVNLGSLIIIPVVHLCLHLLPLLPLQHLLPLLTSVASADICTDALIRQLTEAYMQPTSESSFACFWEQVHSNNRTSYFHATKPTFKRVQKRMNNSIENSVKHKLLKQYEFTVYVCY